MVARHLHTLMSWYTIWTQSFLTLLTPSSKGRFFTSCTLQTDRIKKQLNKHTTETEKEKMKLILSNLLLHKQFTGTIKLHLDEVIYSHCRQCFLILWWGKPITRLCLVAGESVNNFNNVLNFSLMQNKRLRGSTLHSQDSPAPPLLHPSTIAAERDFANHQVLQSCHLPTGSFH